jgi:nucleoside 2-deoxyribosyltransferase
MSKNFYIATAKNREDQANALADILRVRGWRRSFTWSAQDGASTQTHSEIAKQEIDAIRSSDVLIVLLPGGYGTHVEIGAALALGKPVILHAPDRTTLANPYPCVFHYHPDVTLIISETVDAEAIVTKISERC